jgi:hypothetical protein
MGHDIVSYFAIERINFYGNRGDSGFRHHSHFIIKGDTSNGKSDIIVTTRCQETTAEDCIR